MNDSELREQLARRRKSSPLGHAERSELLAAIGNRTSTRRRLLSRRLEWAIPLAAGLAVVLVIVAVGLPRFQQSAAPSPSPSTTATASTPPGQTSTPAAADLTVLSADEVVALALQAAALDRYVISDAQFLHCTVVSGPGASPSCELASSSGDSVCVEGDHLADPITNFRVFRVDSGCIELLGPAVLADNERAWQVEELLADAPAGQPGELFPVRGWLMHTVPAPCAAPPDSSAPHDYWCGGSWITTEPVSTGDYGSVQLTIPGAVHVQWDAYSNFAPDPTLQMGGEPRLGTYLIRPAGCPANVMGDCPVWEMVGRLEPPMGALPNPTPTSSTPSPTPSQSALEPGARLDPSIARPSSAELIGLPEGSLVLARAFDTVGSPALSISALSPSGEEHAIGNFAVPDGLRLLPEPLDQRMAAGRLGPTGFLALAGFKEDSTGEVWIYDLSDPQVPPRGPYPSAHFAWSPRGLISIVSPYGDARVLVVDPTDGTSWHVRPELDRGVGYLWNRDGTGWLAVDTRDEQSFRLGMVSALDGLFQQSTNPGLAFVDGSYLTAEYSAAGEAISTVAIDGDVGPVVLKTGPAGQSDSLSGGTIWFDGRTDEAMPLWVGWDTDGVGLLAVFDEEGQLVLARFDAPGERQTLGVLDPGPSDPASGVQAIHQVPGASRPDVLLEFANRGTTVWFSGVTGESRVVSSSADQTIFGGWILATDAQR